MNHKVCQKCIYLFKAEGENGMNLLCVNKYDRPGQVYFTKGGEFCRNFRAKDYGREKPPSSQSKDVKLIPITQGKFTIVDADDYLTQRAPLDNLTHHDAQDRVRGELELRPAFVHHDYLSQSWPKVAVNSVNDARVLV